MVLAVGLPSIVVRMGWEIGNVVDVVYMMVAKVSTRGWMKRIKRMNMPT
jgi:hypothetical protein